MYFKKFINIFCFIFFEIIIIFISLPGDYAVGNTFEKCRYRFFLQPFQGTKIFIDDKIESGRIISKDKTKAPLQLRLPKKSEKDFLLFKFQNKDFSVFKKKIYPSLEFGKKCKQKQIQLFQLQSPKSKQRLVGYYKTGKWPKSITFINSNRVVVPLLRDYYINVIDINTGFTKKVYPPYKKYGKYHGFVESVYIPQKDEFWVSQMTAQAIHVFSTKDLKYKTTVKLKGIWPKVLLYDQARGRVYCSNWVSKDISVINISTRKEIFRIKTFGVPRGIALSRNGKYLYVAQFTIALKYDYRGRILKIDLEKNKIVKKFGLMGSKRHIVLDKRNRIFVSDIHLARMEIYNANKGELIKTMKIFNNPNTIDLSLNEKYLFISCRGPNNKENYKWKGPQFGRIYILNTRTFELENFIEGGNQPTGLSISPDGKYLVTSDFLDNKIRVYEIFADQ